MESSEPAYLQYFAAKCRRPARSSFLESIQRNALRQTLRDLGFEASDPELAEVYAA